MKNIISSLLDICMIPTILPVSNFTEKKLVWVTFSSLSSFENCNMCFGFLCPLRHKQWALCPVENIIELKGVHGVWSRRRSEKIFLVLFSVVASRRIFRKLYLTLKLFVIQTTSCNIWKYQFDLANQLTIIWGHGCSLKRSDLGIGPGPGTLSICPRQNPTWLKGGNNTGYWEEIQCEQ